MQTIEETTEHTTEQIVEQPAKQKKRVIIANLIDFSESFTDKNGSFYCGTTDEQKEHTADVVELADLVINATDLHPVTAPEFTVNGGLYPVHNSVHPEQYGPDFIFARTQTGEDLLLEDKTLSPRLTRIIRDSIQDRKSGMIVPRGVYFQGEGQSQFCAPTDIEETFDEKIISDKEFIEDDYGYIIAPKQYFDATRLDSDRALPDESIPGVPDQNYDVFSLLNEKFPSDEYEVILVNTGVVEGICRLHTSTGVRQMFPEARVINISDATTPLYGIGLGYETESESRDACEKVCKDIGIEYMTTQEFLDEFKE
ncbi:MAG: hypothetical protein KKG59_07665 [Nanoarchaeota archaeon]|nr:hypothetical protein [Nanoarchaeota archaeon]